MGHIALDSNLKCKVNIIPTVTKDLHFIMKLYRGQVSEFPTSTTRTKRGRWSKTYTKM